MCLGFGLFFAATLVLSLQKQFQLFSSPSSRLNLCLLLEYQGAGRVFYLPIFPIIFIFAMRITHYIGVLIWIKLNRVTTAFLTLLFLAGAQLVQFVFIFSSRLIS